LRRIFGFGAPVSVGRGQHLIRVYDAPIIQRPPAYRNTFCQACGSPLPTMFEGSAFVRIPAGLIQEELPARMLDHIFVGKRAAWWDSDKIGTLPHYEGVPPTETRTRMFRILEPSGR
jgi:hypothetical protein